MTGSAFKREFPEGLRSACQALDKLTGGRWCVESIDEYSKGAGGEPLEAVRVDVDGSASPRFLLALTPAEAGPFAARVNTVYGLDIPVDVGAVLAETANIVISAVLNKIAERCGETLIVTAPRGLRGERGQIVGQVMQSGACSLVARLSAPEPACARLELIAAWDA